MKIGIPKTLWEVNYWYNTKDGYDNSHRYVMANNNEDAINLVKEGKGFIAEDFPLAVERGAKSFTAKILK